MNFATEESTQSTSHRTPVVLEVVVHANVKTFSYLDYSGILVKQYTPNNRIKVFLPNIDAAVMALNKNKEMVIAYLISCSQFVVGENFISKP